MSRGLLKSLSKPKVSLMLALGLSSGIPFMLVGNTLGFWLRESNIALTTIGFLSWVGIAYSFKFVLAPFVDKVPIPVLHSFLGRRRSWMIFSQAVVMIALLGMSFLKPEKSILVFTFFAVLAAVASSIQDIVIDAWRIESSESSDEMALLSSAYQMGYRIALLFTDALILIVAGQIGWPLSYMAMGLSMSIGFVATFLVREPKLEYKNEASLWTPRGLIDAVFGPFVAFVKHHKRQAILILAAVSLYRLPDFMLGPMANPFYTDLGLSMEIIGGVRGSFGLVASLAGIAAGGACAIRFGLIKTLLVGAVLGPLSNLAFSLLAVSGPRVDIFAIAMIVDNFSSGFAGVALVGYMSSLTSIGYTASQYALLSSFYAVLGKILKGFSGAIVDLLSQHYSQLDSYALFFIFTTLIGIPALLFCFSLVRIDLKK